MRRVYTSLLWMVSYCLTLTAQQDHSVNLSTGRIFAVERFSPQQLTEKVLEPCRRGDFWYVILAFHTLPDEKEHRIFQKQGISLFDYLPENAFLARVPVSTDWATLPVRAVLPFSGKYKLSGLFAYGNGDTASNLRLWVYPFPDMPLQEFSVLLRDAGWSKVLEKGEMVEIVLPANQLFLLAGHPAVRFIEPAASAPQPEGWVGRSAQRVNLVNGNPGNGFDGTGVVMAIGDDGSVSHEDFRDRLTDHTQVDAGRHGDMTTGLAIGAGNIDPLGMGTAPGAHLHLFPIDQYQHIQNAIAHYDQYGISITSTSYGEGCGGVYAQSAATVDRQVQDRPGLLHCFSAGNSALEGCGPYGELTTAEGHRYGNLTGGRKAAKNVLAVGNLTYDDQLHPGSSRGPALDGRIKPDLCAQGQGDWTTDAANQYQSGQGTSAAAPSLAGTVATLYQAYRAYYGGNDPSSALIKAVLLNTAEDLGRPGPDFDYGWGRPHAVRALELLKQKQFQEGTIRNGEEKSHSIVVPAGIKEVRVMLYWPDPAGSPLAAKALVNDLDVQLIMPSGQAIRPWVLSTAVHPDSITRPAYRSVDRVNNMEQVSWINPAPGTYSVRVNGFSVPIGPQPYFLVYTFLRDELAVTFPAGGESLVPGETQVIRWDAYGNSGSFRLEYSLNGGSTWSVLAPSLDGSRRHFDWTVPSSTTGNALVRINRGIKKAVSPAPFHIIGLPAFQVAYASPTGARISWNPVNGANRYDIYALGEKYMEKIGETDQLQFEVPVSAGQNQWYSISARHTGGIVGRRAVARLYRHKDCQTTVSLFFQFDNYPGETHWEIRDAQGQQLASGGPYTGYGSRSSLAVEECLPAGCFELIVYDRYGDGVCCQSGNGRYELRDSGGKLLASGGSFTRSESTSFCAGGLSTALKVDMVEERPLTCADSPEGILSCRVEGGQSPYAYRWSNGKTDARIDRLIAGVYQVTVTDAAGKTAVGSHTLIAPDPMTLELIPQDARCYGSADGQLSAMVSGGVGGYRYQWSTGSTASTVSGLSAGWYRLTVTDGKGCTLEKQVRIEEPGPISLNTVVTPLSDDQRGRIDLTVSGGISPFDHRWSNGQTTEDLENLEAGDYTVTVTDRKGCIASLTVSVRRQETAWCAPQGLNTQFEWIERCEIGSWSYRSGNNGGFGDFTAVSVPLQAGKSHSIQLEPGYAANTFREYWRIWIDFNRDGDFLDPGEEVFSADNQQGMIRGSLTVPAGISMAKTRLRIAMAFGNAPDACSKPGYGETEDYSVTITSALAMHFSPGSATDMGGRPVRSPGTDLEIFPNPATGPFTVRYQAGKEEPAELMLFDIFGRVVFSKKILLGLGKNEWPWDTTGWRTGSYVVVLRTSGSIFWRQMIVSSE